MGGAHATDQFLFPQNKLVRRLEELPAPGLRFPLHVYAAVFARLPLRPGRVAPRPEVVAELVHRISNEQPVFVAATLANRQRASDEAALVVYEGVLQA